MKKLIINAGIATATSIAFTALAPGQEAQAMLLVPSSYETTLTNGKPVLIDPTNPSTTPDIVRQTSADSCEVGESAFNEARCFVGFDLSSALDLDPNERSKAQLSFKVADFLGGLGNTGIGATNAGNALSGTITIGQTFGGDGTAPTPTGIETNDMALFDPNPFFGLDPVNIISSTIDFDVDASSVGKTFSFDISALVNALLDTATPGGGPFLSIVLKSDYPTQGGDCGFAGANREVCGGVVLEGFNVNAVPTPAAILPTVLGLASAAMRKKRDEDSDEV